MAACNTSSVDVCEHVGHRALHPVRHNLRYRDVVVDHLHSKGVVGASTKGWKGHDKKMIITR